jgi:hypothetical protein
VAGDGYAQGGQLQGIYARPARNLREAWPKIAGPMRARDLSQCTLLDDLCIGGAVSRTPLPFTGRVDLRESGRVEHGRPVGMIALTATGPPARSKHTR